MASLPSNRQATKLGGVVPAPVPTRVQSDSFGTRAAAPAGGTLSTGRTQQPRPAVTRPGPAQGKESFVASDVGPSVARALNALQEKINSSTAQSRANPFASGHLFQNVPLSGTPTVGFSSGAPPSTDLPNGFVYLDMTLGKPLWLAGSNWVDATGTAAYAATSGTLATTAIEHGFGTPAVGFFITNVSNAVIRYTPRIVLAGNGTDNNTVRIWVAYTALAESPTADFYVYY